MKWRPTSFLLIGIVFFCLLPHKAFSFEQIGMASWYGGIFQGRLTANGEIYDTYGYTCAHKTLPFGTILEVRNLKNQKVVRVRVNDRGPFVDDRIIDLTYAAAKELDMIRDGTAEVLIRTTEGGLPKVRFNVWIGSWGDLENVKRHRKILEDAGLKPTAVLNSNGITRLSVDNVAEADVFGLVDLLKSLGYVDLLVSQVSD